MTDLDHLVHRLRVAGSVFAEDEAALLAGAASSGRDLEQMVLRRVAGEPLEVIVGWAEFCGHQVIVEPGVFVPRARTGLLVEEAVRLVRPGAVVVDLCCGTGAVGLAIHARVDDVRLHASDIEPAALACARRNLEPLGGQVHEGDLFDALPSGLEGTVDLVVVNAPYVPTDAIATMPPEARDHEPRVALDGGHDGVEVHRRLAASAARWLAPAGHLLIETSERQEPLTVEALRRAGWSVRVVTAGDVGTSAVVATSPAGA